MVVRVICGTGSPVTEPGLAVTTVEAMTPTWTLFLAPGVLHRGLPSGHTGQAQRSPLPTPRTRGPVRPRPATPSFIPAKPSPNSPDPSSSPHFRAGHGVTGRLSSHFTPVRARRATKQGGQVASHGGSWRPLWAQGRAAARKPRKNQQLDRDGAEQETCGTDDGDRRGPRCSGAFGG